MLFRKEDYPYKTFEDLNFIRTKCKFCGKYFWSKRKRNFCDDDLCRVKAGFPKYGFIENPVGRKQTYLNSWKTFVRIFKKFNHTPINRYPVIARWRDDVFFVEASIYDFQPYCVSGEVEPPANPLIVPQFCLRFNDLENIGVTGRHYSGFIMVGQHVFNYPDKFIYFKEEGIFYIYKLLTEGFGIPDDEIYFHEDSWEGGGNAGPSIEFFVEGLELGNQVYMQYKKGKNNLVELETKVIDMGAGLERFPWVLNGTKTSYEVVFPEVLNYLSQFNLTEKEKVLLADHTRTLLVTLYDNALPSNTSGGYNLRKILRECFSILRKKNLEINLVELMKIHSNFKIYPELKKIDFDFVEDVLREEERKYRETIKNAITIIKRTDKFDIETLKKLYQSRGITPEMIKEIKPDIELPSYDFRKKEKKEKKDKIFNLDGFPETEKLYYSGEYKTVAKVLKIIDNYVIFDKTVFYPRSGGQDCDLGLVGKFKVLEVIKQGNNILHKIDGNLQEGEMVELFVDIDRRRQLMQHHTGAHIINGAVKRVLGGHAQQAGAEKRVDKAHLDIFHYKSISDEELNRIEEIANNCVKENRDIIIKLMNRTEAEKLYGFEIYQGGVVPGKNIRIVEIKDWDIEACGGLHLSSTIEVDKVIITGIKKIQDSIIRINFLCGSAANNYIEHIKNILKRCSEILECQEEDVYNKAKELFENWKKLKKK
ncbi:MAG: alanine--tRNA ligase [Candidatus Aenigmarchaeota archaeon ex4484_56]|nr:MAG: alanine--tRNA ligase [Candidatus Aenigmarchaeota archaeon ex4484_56]